MTEFFQYIVNGFVVGGVYAIVAVGFVTIYNVSRVINLAQGEFLMLGSMLTVSFISMQVPYGVAMLLAILMVTGLGILMQKYVVGVARQATPLSLIILTIGVSILIRGIASQIWGKDSYSLEPLTGNEPLAIGGVSIARQSVWIVLSVLVILIFLWYLMEKTMIGKKIKACSVNPLAARLMGVSPPRMTMLAFAISAATGALAGIVIAPLSVTSYDAGILLGIKGFSAAIFGGLGSPIGATVAGLLLGLMESLGAGLISSGVKDAIAFLVLIAVLLIRPTGLFGERNVGKGGL
ncbi:branched-chain amino acid ABC transporter permease [Effusibacillus lacus]|uniref:Branched-chain amino acid ABC transporter permease n=1 Tax=Effusibacillus lacus TaxID=1348429 RepID=A0A292YJE1_9BACL|nr:branched-chain amino acid ABC transporter permease [Effusibacillus lacus]TCS72796.1 amino acid/amide ABC transporter membrane protein 1 (HAAT family) [Effusibacillus lacus]GAX89276.1 branched-chain amino acid ABC transporter permease [Effusibacillus lacus]